MTKEVHPYNAYHVHSMLSSGVTNIDSITNFRSYVAAAKDCGMTALGISEHGSIFEWVHKKEAIEAAGMKYLHCIEAYLTVDNAESAVQPDFKKTRDNYHCVLIAKNLDGVHELNKMVSKSFNRNDYHFYYMPRISFDELFATSDNIIVTTACLGGVLHNGTPEAKELFLGFLRANKQRCFLEIQHHNCQEQIEYNELLYNLHLETGIPLIAGTDTHALDDRHMKGRAMLQKAKGVHFSDEDSWDLTFKTPEQLVAAYEKQNSLPMEVIYEAMQNTIVMSDMVEEFELDRSPKYPKLYDDSETVFKQKINEGVVRRGINKLPNYKTYIDRIHYEFDTYKHNGAIDFMLLEEDYKSEMRRRGVRFGYSRGSVSGSIIAYLLGITEIDSVKFNLNFERFMNKERVSLADIDTDWYSDDRKIVKDYLHSKPGLYCCDIVTFNTIALKGAIRDICRGMYYENIEHLPDDVKKEVDEWDKRNRERTKSNGPGYNIEPEPYPKALANKIEKYSIYKEVPVDYVAFASDLCSFAETDEDAARKKYPEIFEYVDLVNGVVVSVGNHPAGCVVSPYPVNEWFGTFTTATDEYPVSLLNMKEIDSLNFIKLDILALDNIGLIYKTCDLAGIPFATPDNIPADDMNVWNSIRDDTTLIFQWESQSATAYLKQLLSDSTVAKIKEKNPNVSYMDLLSMGNGAIRPAGESYREQLSKGEYKTYGNAQLDEFMKQTLGFMIYQEQIIDFLYRFCGFTMGEADIVRRCFAKKYGTQDVIPIITNGGYLNNGTHYIKGFIETMADNYGIDENKSNALIESFLRVIIDASDYLFSKNHSDPYSWIGYICGYLRYYYPLEFITTALNIFEGKEDKSLAIINYAKKHGIKIKPIKFRHSIAQYNLDKETGEIYKGISSIKYMNANVANEMYELRNVQYGSFIDLLFDLKERTTLDSRQLKILIDLDFFSEFADANYLFEQVKLFDTFAGKKQIRKDKLATLGIPEYVVRQYAERETEKMFTKVNMRMFLAHAAHCISCQPRTLQEKIAAQIRCLGYIDIVDEKYLNIAAVISVDTKYSPKLTLYSLRNGTNIDCKINKKTFNKKKLRVGDIIRIKNKRQKAKMRKTEDGEWEPVAGVLELWIMDYEVVKNL